MGHPKVPHQIHDDSLTLLHHEVHDRGVGTGVDESADHRQGHGERTAVGF